MVQYSTIVKMIHLLLLASSINLFWFVGDDVIERFFFVVNDFDSCEICRPESLEDYDEFGVDCGGECVPCEEKTIENSKN